MAELTMLSSVSTCTNYLKATAKRNLSSNSMLRTKRKKRRIGVGSCSLLKRMVEGNCSVKRIEEGDNHIQSRRGRESPMKTSRTRRMKRKKLQRMSRGKTSSYLGSSQRMQVLCEDQPVPIRPL